mgnify:FL=1
MEIGEIMQVAKFNVMRQQQWNKDYDEASKKYSGSTARPQLAFYVFTDKNGNYLKRGFVLKYERDSYMVLKTKKAAIQEREKKVTKPKLNS